MASPSGIDTWAVAPIRQGLGATEGMCWFEAEACAGGGGGTRLRVTGCVLCRSAARSAVGAEWVNCPRRRVVLPLGLGRVGVPAQGCPESRRRGWSSRSGLDQCHRPLAVQGRAGPRVAGPPQTCGMLHCLVSGKERTPSCRSFCGERSCKCETPDAEPASRSFCDSSSSQDRCQTSFSVGKWLGKDVQAPDLDSTCPELRDTRGCRWVWSPQRCWK